MLVREPEWRGSSRMAPCITLFLQGFRAFWDHDPSDPKTSPLGPTTSYHFGYQAPTNVSRPNSNIQTRADLKAFLPEQVWTSSEEFGRSGEKVGRSPAENPVEWFGKEAHWSRWAAWGLWWVVDAEIQSYLFSSLTDPFIHLFRCTLCTYCILNAALRVGT